MMEIYECKICSKGMVKNGRSRSGKQRYYCRHCKKTTQLEYFYKACNPKIDKSIALLITESCGIRSIGRILKISTSTVIRKILRIAKRIVRPFPILQGKEYEVDEVFTYIGNKQRLYWIVYALRRDTKDVIDFKVGKRNLKTLGRVIDTVILSEAKRVFTDGYELYKSLVPSAQHCQKKYNINHIERNNLSLRTHLKRLSRKTICFSKNKTMLEACLKIYFWSEERKSLSLVNA